MTPVENRLRPDGNPGSVRRVEELLLAAQLRLDETHRRNEIKTTLREFVAKNDYFRAKDITAYLKKFNLYIRPLDLTGSEKRKTFLLTVHPESEQRVQEVLEGAAVTAEWPVVKEKLRAEINLEDENRMTAVRFSEWILSEKTADPHEILRLFEKKFSELDPRSRLAFADKPRAYLESLPKDWKDIMYERLCQDGKLTEDWLKVKEIAKREGGVAREKAAGAQFLRTNVKIKTQREEGQTSAMNMDPMKALMEQMNQLDIPGVTREEHRVVAEGAYDGDGQPADGICSDRDATPEWGNDLWRAGPDGDEVSLVR